MANRYWVGGTGTWNTSSTTNWSATPGGASGASVPTAADSVFFDQAATYTVTMTGALLCLDITVSAGTVTFTGTGTPTISGSMSLVAGTVWNGTGTITFDATTIGKTITTNGTTLNGSVTFNGAGGEWSLGSALTLGATLTTTLTQGTINLNGFDLTTGIFSSNNSNTRSINFGANDIILATTTSGQTNLSMANATGFTCTGTGGFDAVTSVTRTFTFGTTGGTSTNAPNLTIGDDIAIPTITANSRFNTLRASTFGGNIPATTVYVNNFIATASSTNMSVVMMGTGTFQMITGSSSTTIAALTIDHSGTTTFAWTIAPTLFCTTYTQTSGNVDFVNTNLNCSGAATYTSGTLTNLGTISCTTWTCAGTFTMASGRIIPSTSFVVTGGFNYNGGTLDPVATFTQTSGTVSFGKAYSLTATGTYTLTSGTLTLNGFNLATGIFSSSNTNTRSINFGTNTIEVSSTTAGTTVLSMANATGFTCTGTGGFLGGANITRTYTFGTTGGSSSISPNLTLTGSGTAIQTFTTNSWFNKLDFGGTAFTVAATTLNLNSLTLSTAAGVYTNLTATMVGTGTIVVNSKSLGPLIINNGAGTTTLSSATTCTTYTQTAGTIDFATFNLTCSSTSTYTAGTLTNTGTITCTTWTCAGTFTMTNGTITPSTSFVVTGGFNYNNGTLSAVPTFTQTSGNVTFSKAYALTATGTYTLTAGTLTLNGFDLTTGIFSSTGAGVRSVAFGTNNIILATTTAAATNLAMATTTNFTWTGTGGFTAAANITRTFQFGSTTAGGIEPNLTFTGSGTAVQTLTTGSYFKKLDFGTTAFNPGTTVLNLNSLTLSSGGTFTGLSATMFREGTITPNGKTIAALTINVTISATPTTTLAGALNCTTYTQTAGTIDFANFNLTCSSTVTYTAGTLTNTGLITCTTWTCAGTFTMTNGTITPSTSFVVTGGFNYNTGTLSAVPTFTQTSGNVTFNKAYALTATGTYTLTADTLTLNGFDLTTGIFSSTGASPSVRSIAFGTNKIILAHTTAATTVLAMGNASNFTRTGTGGFTANASITRTYEFGSGSAGSTPSNSPNLSITSGASVPTFTIGSWFDTLDFTGTTCTPAMNASNDGIYINTLVLATGGTYTGFIPIFTRTQTWTSQFSKQLGGIGVGFAGVTLTLDNTQTYTATAQFILTAGTLDLGGYDLTIPTFRSTNSNTRAISFGSNNIILSTTTAAAVNLSMATTTGFSFTGTGSFTAAADITRTFTVGTTAGSAISSPPLTLTGSGTAVQTFTNGSYFSTLNFGTTAFTVASTTLNLNSLILSSGGTFTNLTAIMVGTGTITTNGKTILALTVNCPSGTTTLADALTLVATGTAALTSGTLNLGGFDLTTGIFSSTNTNTRSISFGSNNIILAHTTAATTVLSMATATNFTWTGTGGFTAAADITRTYTFGTTGGSSTNSPNLSLTGSGTAVQTFTTGSWFNILNFGTTAFTVATPTLNLDSLILSTGGTFTNLSVSMVGTGTITTNGKTISALTVNCPSGTTTLSDALTTTGITTLTNGTLNLNNLTLTTGTFSSNNSNTRSITFGTSNIVLTTTTAAATNLDMAITTGFTYTGTGVFTTTMSVTRTFTVGTTGGSVSNAPTLLLTSGASIPTFTDGSWFNALNFTGSTCTPAMSASSIGIYVDTLTLATGGTYTGLIPVFTRTQTWTSQFSKQLGGIGVGATGVTLTLDNTQTYTATSSGILNAGTLNLGGYDLTIGIFSSNNSNTRSISFGSNNIILSTTTAAATNISMANATNFTWTGTGGFTAAADITRTYTFGTTGGSSTNSLNLSLTGSGTAIQTLTTGSWFNILNFGTTAFALATTTLNLNSVTLSSGGTFTSLTITTVGTGTLTTNGKTILALTVNCPSGTTTLAGAVTTGATATTTLTNGTLDLGGFTLTTGIFSSNNSNTRSISFGSNNIILSTTTAATTNISMADATGFTYTGTGGFTAAADITRTYTFGTTGGSSTNSLNLSLTGSGTAIQTFTTTSWFNNLNFGTTAFALATTTLNLNSLTLSSGGTFTSLSATMVGTGTITSNGKTIAALTVNCPSGTTTLAGAVTTGTTAATTLTAGTLDLGGFSLTTGTFSSNNTNTRSIIFGSINVSLATTTAGATNIDMANASGFTYTGTGGFTTAMSVTRTFNVGTTSGSETNAPNLLLTSGASIPTFTSGSWFKTLNFTGTTSTPATTIVNVDTLTLATGGTYTGLTPIFTRTQTWTAQFSKQLNGIGVNGSGITLTLDGTQTYTATSTCYVTQGTLNLGGANQTFGAVDSNNTNTRAITFGSNNIILGHTTAGTTVINIPDATGFSYTGAGGFTTAMSVTRTFTFGTTGGSESNAPNLSLTSGASIPTITSGSWFKALNFTGTTCTPATTIVNVDTLTLATGGTYTGLTPIFTRTQTWTAQFSKQLNGIGVNGSGITLTLDGTQTYTGLSTLIVNAGTLNTSTLDLNFYNFSSTGTGSRSITGTRSITISNSWTVTSGSGFTGTSYRIKMAKSTTKTFAGGGGSYGTLIQQTASQLNITGSNTFADIQVNPDMVQSGQQEFTTAGTYSWTAPSNVTTVSVVAVGAGSGGIWNSGTGGGGGAGGGLGWRNDISVVPGQTYSVVVGAGSSASASTTLKGGDSYFINTNTVAGLGGGGAGSGLTGGIGGSYVGDGGGNGGNGGTASSSSYGGGAGGAGGYAGNGGAGAVNSLVAGNDGAGGGSGGGSGTPNTGVGGGGGVGIYGQGASGDGGSAGSSSPGQPGSGGSVGTLGNGGLYGGGGSGGDTAIIAGNGAGASGAVRIIWGSNRAFPSTNTGNL